MVELALLQTQLGLGGVDPSKELALGNSAAFFDRDLGQQARLEARHFNRRRGFDNRPFKPKRTWLAGIC